MELWRNGAVEKWSSGVSGFVRNYAVTGWRNGAVEEWNSGEMEWWRMEYWKCGTMEYRSITS